MLEETFKGVGNFNLLMWTCSQVSVRKRGRQLSQPVAPSLPPVVLVSIDPHLLRAAINA